MAKMGKTAVKKWGFDAQKFCVGDFLSCWVNEFTSGRVDKLACREFTSL